VPPIQDTSEHGVVPNRVPHHPLICRRALAASGLCIDHFILASACCLYASHALPWCYKVKYFIEALLRQRIYGLAKGYADANEASLLCHGPVFEQLLDRSPISGASPSSQPTRRGEIRSLNFEGSRDFR
jgi:hypothetical protein